jgi:hypothetical protein
MDSNDSLFFFLWAWGGSMAAVVSWDATHRFSWMFLDSILSWWYLFYHFLLPLMLKGSATP